MLGRGTLGRWAAAKTSARDLPQLARFLHQTLTARNASNMPAARALARAYRGVLGARRSYATTTATKPTATVKKAVKAQAASKAAPKKTAAATKTAKKPAKKPVKKTTAAKAKAKPKAAPKPKKKKAAAKKPAPKKRVKKVLTPEQKEKAKIRELRLRALKEPVIPRAISARNAYVGEKLRGSGENAANKLAEVGKAFSTLTPAEVEVSR
jgi:outer membrane biosynthesis protein TonB